MIVSSAVRERAMDLLGFLWAFAVFASAISMFWAFEAHLV